MASYNATAVDRYASPPTYLVPNIVARRTRRDVQFKIVLTPAEMAAVRRTCEALGVAPRTYARDVLLAVCCAYQNT